MSLPAGDTAPRRLTAGDAAAMQALEAACFSLPWSEEQCRAAFSQQAFVAYGLEEAGVLQGYISLYQAADELEVLNLAVLPVARRQGLGERLLRTALQEAEKTGINRALLEVRPGMPRPSPYTRNAASSGWANGPAIMRTPAKMP